MLCKRDRMCLTAGNVDPIGDVGLRALKRSFLAPVVSLGQ